MACLGPGIYLAVAMVCTTQNWWTPLVISILAAGMVLLININFSGGGKHFTWKTFTRFLHFSGLWYGLWSVDSASGLEATTIDRVFGILSG